ncbi:MAG: hypothetical protein ACJARP_001318 [Vicingaceae bacterium]|jgi:hypothetical protein
MKNTFLISILIFFSANSFGQSEYANFLKKFKPSDQPLIINSEDLLNKDDNGRLTKEELKNYLNISYAPVDENEDLYIAEFIIEYEDYLLFIYSHFINASKGDYGTKIHLASINKERRIIDTLFIGRYADEQGANLQEHYTSSIAFNIGEFNIFVERTHTVENVDDYLKKIPPDSTFENCEWGMYPNGYFEFSYRENLSDTSSVRAKFKEFSMGDAVSYDFETESGENIDFAGKAFIDVEFGVLLPESEMNSENQGWRTNTNLQDKWFKISYIEREQPLYINGPIGKVKVIIKAVPDDNDK